MKVRLRASFATDLQAIKDKSLLDRVKTLIATVESVPSLMQTPNLKKLHGGGNYIEFV